MKKYKKEIEDAKHIAYLKFGKLVAIFERDYKKKSDYIMATCMWRATQKNVELRWSIGQLYTIFCDTISKNLMRNEEYYKKSFECRPATETEVNMAVVMTKLAGDTK